MAKILQANMNRSRTANELIHQIAREKQIDLILISEQYKNITSPYWISDPTNTAAIWIYNPSKVSASKYGSFPGFAWIDCDKIRYFSCYLTPNESIQNFRDKIDALEDAMRGTDGCVVVAGDFNARAAEWGMPHPNSRGKYILEMAARNGLLVMNIGTTTTFRRPGYGETIPDITLASESLAPQVKDWMVSEDYTGSDHQYIVYKINNAQENNHEHIDTHQIKWDINKLKPQKFVDTLQNKYINLERTLQLSQATAEAYTETTM